jgi:hypothetical protein
VNCLLNNFIFLIFNFRKKERKHFFKAITIRNPAFTNFLVNGNYLSHISQHKSKGVNSVGNNQLSTDN